MYMIDKIYWLIEDFKDLELIPLLDLLDVDLLQLAFKINDRK